MALSLSMLSALLLAIQAQGYALPNPQAAAVTSNPTNTASAALEDSTLSAALPQSYYDALLANSSSYSIDPAALVLESAAYASYTKEFYATAAPSQLAAISSYDKAQSSAYAAWTSGLDETIGTSEYNALTSAYARFTSQEAIYATYTGTGVPPGITANPVNGSSTTPAQPTTSAESRLHTLFPPLKQSQDHPDRYGVTCGVGTQDVDYSACGVSAAEVCNSIGDPNTLVYDQWVWSTRGPKCAIGYYRPTLGEPKFATAAPEYNECIANVLGVMSKTCVSEDAIGDYNVASVNMKELPVEGTDGFAVEATQMSFILAASPYPCGLKGCHMIPF